MFAPLGSSGASATWNGPSTVFSVAPVGRHELIGSTSIETPRISDSRMNSYRQSVQVWPVIAEIIDAGGITEAAISLGTSQPAISRVVKMLEQRLGEPLFHRVRKPLQLTSAGAVLADQGRAIRTAALRASDNLDRLRAGSEGSLRVGGTPFFLDGFVSGLIAEFHADRPNLTIDFTHGYTDELIALIVADRLDVALCPVDILAPEADVSFTPLLPGRNVIACRVGHPLLSKPE